MSYFFNTVKAKKYGPEWHGVCPCYAVCSSFWNGHGPGTVLIKSYPLVLMLPPSYLSLTEQNKATISQKGNQNSVFSSHDGDSIQSWGFWRNIPRTVCIFTPWNDLFFNSIRNVWTHSRQISESRTDRFKCIQNRHQNRLWTYCRWYCSGAVFAHGSAKSDGSKKIL